MLWVLIRIPSVNEHPQRMCHLMTKPTKCNVHPAKTQTSLGIRPVWSAFAVRMKKPWVLSYPLSAQRRLIRLVGGPGWSQSLMGAQSFCWVFHVAAHLFFGKLSFNCHQIPTLSVSLINEPRPEKTCLRGLGPGKTQTGLLSCRDQL